jgi:type II secretory pathway component PulM
MKSIDNINDIKSLSIIELKQLLSRVNQDIKSIKKQEKIAANNQPSEYDIANNIAKSFTGKVYPKPVENKRIKQDIQIQQDILDYLNNGGRIITAKPRKSRKYSTAPFVVALSNKVSL